MNIVKCPTCQTRVIPKLDGTCPSCLAIIPKKAKDIKPKTETSNNPYKPKFDKNSDARKPNDINNDNDAPRKNTQLKSWIKNTFISIPFIILVAYIMLIVIGQRHYIFGALGILEFTFVDPSIELFSSFCTVIGPLILVAIGYAKLAQKTGINFKLLVFWVFTIMGCMGIVVLTTLDVMKSYFESTLGAPLASYGPVLSNPGTYIYIVFMLIGIFGIVNNRYKKRVLANRTMPET